MNETWFIALLLVLMALMVIALVIMLILVVLGKRRKRRNRMINESMGKNKKKDEKRKAIPMALLGRGTNDGSPNRARFGRAVQTSTAGKADRAMGVSLDDSKAKMHAEKARGRNTARQKACGLKSKNRRKIGGR
jgi:hypothetical protein